MPAIVPANHSNGPIQPIRWMNDRIMKMLMMIVPRAIQEVPGFMNARSARNFMPRSAIRKPVPIASSGNPRAIPLLAKVTHSGL